MTTCVLHRALGRDEECPGEECGLWTDGCAVQSVRLDLLEREDLAQYLLDLRSRLEQLRPAS